jgi:hypothetical protein
LSRRTARPFGQRGRFQLMWLSPRLPVGVAGASLSVRDAEILPSGAAAFSSVCEAPWRASGRFGRPDERLGKSGAPDSALGFHPALRTRRPTLSGAARAGEPCPHLSRPKLSPSISLLTDPRWRCPDSRVLLFWLEVSAPARVRGRGCQLRLRRHAGAPPRPGPCRDRHQVSKSQLRLSFRILPVCVHVFD